ncbi:MAG: DNA-directed RNA polymerase subunit alpha [Dehalococcoidia bacterium]
MKPSVEVVETEDTYGKFSIEPLERGFGVTLGNSLRRVLLSSIEGAAVTWIKVDGVQHEYSTIPHVTEDVTEFLLNVKAIRLQSHSDRPGKLVLDVKGEGVVCAGDISPSADYEVVNPELPLANVDSEEGRLSVEFNVERGTGYIPAGNADGLPLGALPVDAIFTPVRKVNYDVDNVRVGQATNKERLILEVWTDGTVSPVDALREAGQNLVEYFFLFSNAGKVLEQGDDKRPLALSIPPEQYNILIENLGLSARTHNCLKRANIDKVGEVLETSKEELLAIRNFGEKSLMELYQALEAKGLLVTAPAEDEAADEGQEGDEPLQTSEGAGAGAENEEGKEGEQTSAIEAEAHDQGS